MRKVIPIMGPGSGNKDLEDCPPAAHFELTGEELMQLIEDTEGTAKRLGLRSGIKSVHISIPDGEKLTAGAMYCCIDCLTDSVCCKKWPPPQQ